MNVSKIKERLPHGALQEIAKQTDTGYITVINFFNGKLTPKNKNQILQVAIDILKKEKEKTKQLNAEFEMLLNSD